MLTKCFSTLNQHWVSVYSVRIFVFAGEKVKIVSISFLYQFNYVIYFRGISFGFKLADVLFIYTDKVSRYGIFHNYHCETITP